MPKQANNKKKTITPHVSTPKFSSMADEWLSIHMPQFKPSTVARYTHELDAYLKPHFGDQEISGIQRADLLRLGSEMLLTGGMKGKGLAPATVNSLLSLMKNILQFACQEKSVPVADTKHISVRQPQKRMRVLTVAEQRRFVAFLSANPNPRNAGILLTLYTGLRIGEICALKWGDIDLADHLLHVRRTMQRVRRQEAGDKKTAILILPPKSACSVRTIPLPQEIVNLLKKHKSGAETYLLTGKEKWVEPRVLQDYFQKTAKKNGLQGVTYHTLRHTFATRCVELGFDVKSLSELLGHSNVAITMNRYVHPSMDLKKKNMNKLTGFIPVN